MKQKEIIVRKTLDFLLQHAHEVDLNLISIAIEDYEEDGYNLGTYRDKLDKLRKDI